MATKWALGDIPDQAGRRVVVTGANSGLGRVTSLELARRGAHVTLACRDTVKGQWAADQIRFAVPQAQLDVSALDLADLGSVERFGERFATRYDRLDLLVNNAGVMATPKRLTADGFELQFGTNHLGHFALTAHLLDRLLAAPAGRVVTVSSSFHKIGRVDVDRLGTERYHRWLAYARSKLANLLFGLELERRSRAASTSMRSIVAHPGYAATNLQFASLSCAPARLFMTVANGVFAMSPEQGALSLLYAATAPVPPGASFVGPGGWTGQHGYPELIEPGTCALDDENARRLWQVSEELTGVHYDFPAPR